MKWNRSPNVQDQEDMESRGECLSHKNVTNSEIDKAIQLVGDIVNQIH